MNNTPRSGVGVSHNFALIALLKTLHEEGHDPWSAFSELTLAIVQEGQNLEELMSEFFVSYKVAIPEGVAHTVLKRLRRENHLTYSNKNGPYLLTEAGSKKAAKAKNSARSFTAEFDSLIDDLRSFLKERGLDVANIEKEFIAFIDANLSFTSDVVSSNPNSSHAQTRNAEIASYIAVLESRSPQLFKVLQNIFFGRLYLQIFNKPAPIESNATFAELDVFIDTNIVLSLLGLDDPQNEKSLKTLVATLNQIPNVSIKIFDVTVAETKRVLLTAASNIEKKNYIDGFKVNSLAWRLKNKGYDAVTITSLIENLPTILEELGVIEATCFDRADDRAVKNVERLNRIYGQNKSNNAIDHDAELITNLQVLKRGAHSSLLEKSKAIFLTTDNAIIVDAKETARKEGSFPLAISPVELTCLVWLKNMDEVDLMQATLRQALMAYAREKMLEGDMWNKFVERLSLAKKTGEINDETIALIVNNEQTRTLLYEQGDKGVDRVLDEKYINRLRQEKKKSDAIKKQDKDKLGAIESKKQSISHVVAVTIYTILAVLVAALLVILIVVAVRKFELDFVVNLFSLIPVLLLIVSLTSGRVLKIKHLTTFRSNSIHAIEMFVKRILERIFYT